MATSRPEDAPRGMEFLYSLNRLNVATSRARCAAIVVGSPKLWEPACRTPRQMMLANALCRLFASVQPIPSEAQLQRRTRIEVMRVRGQIPKRRPRGFDEGAHASRLVGRQVVEQHDVAGTQPRHQTALHPVDEAGAIHGAPRGAQRQPPIDADGADQRQVVAPIHGARFHQDGAAWQPRVRPSHGQMGAGFIEEDQPRGVYASDPSLERAPLGLDRGTILFRRSRSFFLNTYPERCNARRMLERCTRAAGATARLYARVSSSVVRSGCSCTSAWSRGISTGDRHPPPLSVGATVPRSRDRCTQRSNVFRPIENRVATSAYVSVLVSYARTARSRRGVGYGFGTRVIDHKLITNSSEIR